MGTSENDAFQADGLKTELADAIQQRDYAANRHKFHMQENDGIYAAERRKKNAIWKEIYPSAVAPGIGSLENYDGSIIHTDDMRAKYKEYFAICTELAPISIQGRELSRELKACQRVVDALMKEIANREKATAKQRRKIAIPKRDLFG